MRRALFMAISFAALGLPGEAGAQTLYNQAGAQPGYGGGFIEMLMTGRDPSPALRPQRAYPDRALSVGAEPPGAYRRYAGRPIDPAGEIAQPALDATYRKQIVAYDGREAPGTIVVDTPSKFLYLVQGNGQALRYGIGVGRPGFAWAGVKTVSAKKEWPGWTPPPEMLKRRPDLPRHMEGGPANPLGARALYLGSSLYRIHGTNEPDTIGRNVSSGCIRMMNEDVTDLYERVPVGTRVIVI
jgi:lipoprotein-anchoring transpeptidase ErfK/SrfK